LVVEVCNWQGYFRSKYQRSGSLCHGKLRWKNNCDSRAEIHGRVKPRVNFT